jgi:hypothetical protein
MTEYTVQESEAPALPPVKVAFVIDGNVVDVLHTDERLSAIFLSDPLVIDVTEWYSNEENANKTLVNASYNQETETFLLSSGL